MAEVLTSWDAAPVAFDANFNTKLTPAEENSFKAWKAKYAPKDSGEDYDLRGAFKAGLKPDPKTGHWPDTFKKPNEPTFSNESIYAAYGKPGSWAGPNHDQYVPWQAPAAANEPPVVSSWDNTTPAPTLMQRAGEAVKSVADWIKSPPAIDESRSVTEGMKPESVVRLPKTATPREQYAGAQALSTPEPSMTATPADVPTGSPTSIPYLAHGALRDVASLVGMTQPGIMVKGAEQAAGVGEFVAGMGPWAAKIPLGAAGLYNASIADLVGRDPWEAFRATVDPGNEFLEKKAGPLFAPETKSGQELAGGFGVLAEAGSKLPVVGSQWWLERDHPVTAALVGATGQMLAVPKLIKLATAGVPLSGSLIAAHLAERARRGAMATEVGLSEEVAAAATEHARARLDALDLKAKGTPDVTTNLDGKPVTIPGEQPQFLTHEEKSERDFLRRNIDKPEAIATAYGMRKTAAPAPGAVSVADQLRAVRPQEAPEPPTAGPAPVEGEGPAKPAPAGAAPAPFNPTADWQPIPPDAVLPPGLEIRMNMQTGQNDARVRGAPTAAPAPAAPPIMSDWGSVTGGEHVDLSTYFRKPVEDVKEGALRLLARGDTPMSVAAQAELARRAGGVPVEPFPEPRAGVSPAPGVPPPESAIPAPAGAELFIPKPGDAPDVPRHALPGIPIVYLPVEDLVLSEDVPNFKAGANSKGVVEPLTGKLDYTGLAPVQIWERLNGDKEVISGRHRLDLAERNGPEVAPVLPAQIHREADGFDVKQAQSLDAILNIRDGQGSVADYANYFKAAEVEEGAAKSAGLLDRAKGKNGFAIARDAGPEVFAAHRAGLLSDEAAVEIAKAAPQNQALQAVGLKLVNEGRPISLAVNTMRALSLAGPPGVKPEQGDIFGFDDSLIKEQLEVAKRAAAAQREIREQIAAVSGATKRPEIARKLGVDVKDPEAVQAKIEQLRAESERMQNWPLYPDLVEKFGGRRAEPAQNIPENIPMVEPERAEVPRGTTPAPDAVQRAIDQRDQRFEFFKASKAIKDAKTGQPFTQTLIRGEGSEESPYNALGPQEAILGPGRYTTTDTDFAKEFGPNISEVPVELKNPLVIDNDVQWRALTKKAGWEFPNPIRVSAGGAEKASAEIAKMRSMLEADGYDGAVINVPESEADGKAMQKVFGASQVVEFNPPGVDTKTQSMFQKRAPYQLEGETEAQIRDREAASKTKAKAEADAAAKDEEAARAERERKEIAERSKGADFALTPTEAVDKKTQAAADQRRAEADLAGQGSLFQKKSAYDPKQLELNYERAPTRPGTTDAQRETGRKALAGWVSVADRLAAWNRNAGRGEATLLGSAMWRDFEERGGTELVGKKFGSPNELALAAQVLRDPRWETMRVFFTKEGEVVHHTGWTARKAGSVNFSIEGNYTKRMRSTSSRLRLVSLKHEMAAQGADGYYLLHNHPNGLSIPSAQDVSITRMIQDEMPGFLGHVVIDHDEFSAIDAKGNVTTTKLEATPKPVPEAAHDILGTKISGPKSLVKAAQAITSGRKGYSTLVATNAKGEIQALAEVPDAMLEGGENKVAKGRAVVRIGQFMEGSGSAGRAFIVGDNPGRFDWLISRGTLTDAISADGTEARSTEVERGEPPLRGTKAILSAKQEEPEYGGEKDKDEIPKVVAGGVGLTPSILAKVKGAIGDAARAVVARAQATKLGAAASEWGASVTEDAQLKTIPMAAGTDAARAIAKDFANADRLSRWQWARFDDIIKKNYTPEQQQKMWDAGEEENQLRLEEVPQSERAGRGLDKLTPEERKTMDTLQEYGDALLARARDVGMFRGEGVKYWVPRMVAMIGKDGEVSRPKAKGGIPEGPARSPYSSPSGGNITTQASSLKQRKYATAAETEAAAKTKFGEEAYLARNIRTMPMAMARIERAIAGRELINAIKEFGKDTGQETVAEAPKDGYFTIDHPAFKTYRYRPDLVYKEAWDRQMWDQQINFARSIGVEPERMLSMRGGTWGWAKQTGEVRTRFGGPETVLTHELGHQLDFKYGLVNKFFGGDRPKSDFILQRQIDKAAREGNTGLAEKYRKQMTINGEMRDLADLRFEGQEATDYYRKYVRKGTEKMANMVHAYVHAPEKFKAVAPTAYREFKSFIANHPELAQLDQIKPSLTLTSGGFRKRPPGEDFDVFPVWVSKEFEGPLKSIMTDQPGTAYKAMMALKGKSMSVIMYSPLIHNGVEWGRALPAMPGKVATFKVYFEGNMAKNDPAIMSRFIDGGLVPIGHRFFMQDISGLLEEPELKPGRSWTAKIAGGAVGLVNKSAGEAVKRGIDTAGDFWHNTLLWDRVADLQMGLAINFERKAIQDGLDPQSATRLAAHMANRFAGALPNEAMSANARKLANFIFFSRTFTFGNLGVMKDMMTGLPRDVQAQIGRDAGEVARFAAKGEAQRVAISAFTKDIALMYVANSALQSGFDYLKRDKSLSEIEQGYIDRFDKMLKHTKENPTDLLKPFAELESLTPMSENEPGKEYRVLYDFADTGTATYVRLPMGKIGEEFLGYATGPLDMLHRKLGTVARPIWQILDNDRGYGRHVWNPYLKGYEGAFKAVGNSVMLMFSSQVPGDTITSAIDMARGRAEEGDAMKVIGPLFGLTFSKGAPGGPEVGEMYTVEAAHRAEVSDVMPDVKRLIKNGDNEGAVKLMYENHMTPSEIRMTLRFATMPKSRMTPQAMKKFFMVAPPEERERMQQMRENQQ